MTEAPLLRPAVLEDVPDLADFSAENSAEPHGAAFFERYCANSGSSVKSGDHGVLAIADDAILGYLVYGRVLERAEIVDFLVRPCQRGRGHGRLLLRETLARMASQGAEHCQLEVRASNAPAIRLYEAEGFLEDGRRNDYYPREQGGREDALLMSKSL